MKSISLSFAMIFAAVFIFVLAFKSGKSEPRDADLEETATLKTASASIQNQRSTTDLDQDDQPIDLEPSWSLEARPFPVSQSSERFQWTSADGLDPKVIKQLTLYREHEEVLLEQNAITKRRQLVYLPENFREIAEELFAGDRLEVPVPGFDGEEFVIKLGEPVRQEVYHDGDPLSGTFVGSLHSADGKSLNIEANGAFVNNFWSIGFEYQGGTYIYENRGEFEEEWIITEIDTPEISNFTSPR